MVWQLYSTSKIIHHTIYISNCWKQNQTKQFFLICVTIIDKKHNLIKFQLMFVWMNHKNGEHPLSLIFIPWRWITWITIMKLSSTNIVLSTPILANQNTLYIENRLAVSPTRKKKKEKQMCLKSFMPGQPDHIIYI